MKKWISVLLSVAILFTSIPIQTVFAQELEDASISTDATEDFGAAEDDSADEESSVRQDCTANFQFIQEDGTFATENDVKVRVVNDCLMVDAFWIFQKLGLKFKIHKSEDEDLLPQRMGSYGNRYIKEMAAGYNAIFGDNSDGVEIEVHKENVDWSFYFQVGSSKMYSYSEYFGQVSTELGSEVECLDNGDGTLTYWIPLFMFLNIFDTAYVIADGTLRISPCPTTVTDIMHMSNLDDYYYDVIEDSGIGEMGYITALSFEKFYNTLKSLSQGVVTISWNTLSQAFPQNDENMEGFAKQLCIPDNIQAEKIQSHADIHSVVSGSAAAATDSFSQILGDAVTSEKNQAQTLTNRVNQIIQIPASSEEIAAANEKVQKLAEESELLEKYNQKFGTAFTALDSIFVVLFTYLSASNEINAASQKQIDALKMYMDSSETYEQFVLDDNVRNAIQDKIEMYDGKNDNILTNPSVADELINTVGDFWMSYDVNNVVVPTLLEGLLEEGVAEAASTILVDLQLISLGWDGAELLVNTVLGTFDTLDCVQLAMYAMGLEYDSQTVLKDYKNELKQSSIGEEEIEKYRKLEWVRLESYCLARENVLGIYEAEKNDHPEEYQTVTEYDRGKEAELAEWMAVLLNGFKGFNRESLDEFAADCQTYNQALIDEMDVSYFVTGELMTADNELSEANIVLTNSDGEVVASDAIAESTTSKHLEFKVLRGTYNLSVIASGYETYSQSVTVERGNIGLGEIVLQPKKATVSVTVADSNGNPMEGVNVNFQLPVVVESVNHERNETTDAEGRINVKVPVASYTFTFTKDGYQTNTLETAVEADGDLGIVTLEQAIFDVKDYLYSMENLVAALGLTNTSTTESCISARNDLVSISADSSRTGIVIENRGDKNLKLFDIELGDSVETAVEKIKNYGSVYWRDKVHGMDSTAYVGALLRDSTFIDVYFDYGTDREVITWYLNVNGYTAGGFTVQDGTMESILELENTLDMASLPDWKKQYINIIKQNYLSVEPEYELYGYGKYDLAYIDGDDIPELVEFFVGTSGSQYSINSVCSIWRVYSYRDGAVKTYNLTEMDRSDKLGFDYLERENRIAIEEKVQKAHGGERMYIYELGDTEGLLLGEGFKDNWAVILADGINSGIFYYWDDVKVTEEEYNNNMNRIYGDSSSSKYIDLSDELESVQKILQH